MERNQYKPLTRLAVLEEDLAQAIKDQDGFWWTYGNAFAAHQQYMGWLMEAIAKEKEDNER
jgi:hypothetical protein